MGFLDKAKDLAGKAKQGADQAKDLADQHADKLPGDMGAKVTDAVNKADELTDKIPNMGDGPETTQVTDPQPPTEG